MITGSNFKESLNRADLDIKFSEGMQSRVSTDYEKLIEVVESISNSKTEVFYGDKSDLRRWRGTKKPNQFEEYKMTLTADAWESTREWKVAELNRQADPQKFLMTKIMNFGKDVAKTKENEIWKALRLGVSTTGFDRHPLFGPAHVYVNASGASNTLVASQSNVDWGGSQLSVTTIQLDDEHFANVRTDKNNVWGTQLDTVIVRRGSVNDKAAREISNSQFTVEASTVKGQMTTNVFNGYFDIIRTDHPLWGASEWATASLGDNEFKPLKVLSETMNPGFNNPLVLYIGLEDDNTSEGRFWRGDVAASVEMNWDVNPGYWQTIKLHGSSGFTYTPADLENQRLVLPNQF